MPTDSGGTYSLPAGSTATTGDVILASEHNTPLDDIATALTARLPVDGSKGMSGTLKVADGSAATPSVAFGSDTTTGFFKKTTGTVGVSASGSEVGSIGPSGLTVANLTVSGTFTPAAAYALAATTITAGSGLTGGGDLSTNRSLAVSFANASETLTGSSTSKAVTPGGLAGNAGLTSAGYFKLPGGLILQWGTCTGGSVVTFTASYSSFARVVVSCLSSSTMASATSVGLTGFTPATVTDGGTVVAASCHYFAIGV